MKQFVLLLCTVFFGMVPITVFAYTAEIDGIYYDFSGAEAIVTNYEEGSNQDAYTGNVAIPETVIYGGTVYPVTSIGAGAFIDCSGLTGISIPPSVKKIDNSAFARCTALKSVNVPSSVEYIETFAFSGCTNLSTIIISNPATFIGGKAFWGTAWYNNLSDGLVYIGKWAYSYKGIMPTNSNIIIKDGTVGISSAAFDGCSGLYSISIPNTVTYIGHEAFYSCSSLVSLSIPSSVETIRGDAFNGCSSLTEISIPETVSEIEYGTFANCTSLETITIPSSVNKISPTAFSGCKSLKEVVEKRKTPISIEYNTFPDSYKITLYVPYGCKDNYVSDYYWKEFKEIVEMPDSSPIIEFADANVKAICVANWDTNGDGELSEAEAETVTELGSRFMGNSSILSFDELRFFSGLKQIDDYGFYGCSELTSIEIPFNVTSIGNSAFMNCQKMKSVILPKSIEQIGLYAFDMHGWDNSMTSVYISDLESWCKISFSNIESNPIAYGGHLVLNGEEIKDLVIPDGITSINYAAFYGCYNLTSVTIPSSVTSIGKHAFRYCYQMTTLNMGKGVKTVGVCAFDGCSGLSSVIIPTSVNTISSQAFQGCNSAKVVLIPDGVTSIGSSAFYGCKSLTSLIIPQSIAFIGDHAFGECSGMTSLTMMDNEPLEIEKDPFPLRQNITLYIPKGSKNAYEAIEYWAEFKDIIEKETSSINFADANIKALCVANWDTNGDGELSEAEAAVVTSLKNVFKEKQNIVTFDELKYFTGITSINANAFYGCSNLMQVTMPNSVTSIDDYAFRGCLSLTGIEIPSSVISIGEWAFNDTGLISITMPSGLKNIGAYAFHGTNLISVTIPSSVTTIGDAVFGYCKKLTSITVENGNSKYNSSDNCNAIIETETNTLIAGCKSTKIPSSVARIANVAFQGCEMTSIDFPSSVTSIGAYAFNWCDQLVSLNIPSNVTNIGEWCFYGCDNLISVTSNMRIPVKIEKYTFSNAPNATLYVPAGCKALYEAADYWKEFKEIIEMNEYDSSEDTDISQMENVIYIARTEVCKGTMCTLPIYMKNTALIHGFQFNLYLPEGMTVVKSRKGKIQATLIESRLPEDDDHILTTQEQSDGSILFQCSSQYDENFVGGDGELLTISVNIAEEMEEGDYSLILRNIKLTESELSKCYDTSEVKSTLTVVARTFGDVNNDGTVNALDIQEVINAAASESVEAKYDVNNDGIVNALDIQEVINIAAVATARQFEMEQMK